MSLLIKNQEFELIENVRDGFEKDEVESKLTDYFDLFDYIVGDWAYSKLRLKGFYDPKSKKCKEYNNINGLKKYLKDNCAYNCKYFVLKRVYKNK